MSKYNSVKLVQNALKVKGAFDFSSLTNFQLIRLQPQWNLYQTQNYTFVIILNEEMLIKHYNCVGQAYFSFHWCSM